MISYVTGHCGAGLDVKCVKGPTMHASQYSSTTYKQSTAAYLALEMVVLMCLAPEASAVMKGKLMSVCVAELSSHLAFSAASLSL